MLFTLHNCKFMYLLEEGALGKSIMEEDLDVHVDNRFNNRFNNSVQYPSSQSVKIFSCTKRSVDLIVLNISLCPNTKL